MLVHITRAINQTKVIRRNKAVKLTSLYTEHLHVHDKTILTRTFQSLSPYNTRIDFNDGIVCFEILFAIDPPPNGSRAKTPMLSFVAAGSNKEFMAYSPDAGATVM